jgi:hypothetical protein
MAVIWKSEGLAEVRHLEHPADVEQLLDALGGVRQRQPQVATEGSRIEPDQPTARALTNLDHAESLQSGQGFPDALPAHVELLGQQGLGRQHIPRGIALLPEPGD